MQSTTIEIELEFSSIIRRRRSSQALFQNRGDMLQKRQKIGDTHVPGIRRFNKGSHVLAQCLVDRVSAAQRKTDATQDFRFRAHSRYLHSITLESAQERKNHRLPAYTSRNIQ